MKKVFILILCIIFSFSSCLLCFANPSSLLTVPDNCVTSNLVNGYSTFVKPDNVDDASFTFVVNNVATYVPVYLNGIRYIYYEGYYYQAFLVSTFTIDNIYIVKTPKLVYDSTSYTNQSPEVFIFSAKTFDNVNLATFRTNKVDDYVKVFALFGVDFVFDEDQNRYFLSSEYIVCTAVSSQNSFSDFVLYLSDFSSNQFNIWQSIINFVMIESNSIALISIFSWLFVIGIGGIRRLITGV